MTRQDVYYQVMYLKLSMYECTVEFGYSGHGFSGHLGIVATLAGTESFPTISSLKGHNTQYSGHTTSRAN